MEKHGLTAVTGIIAMASLWKIKSITNPKKKKKYSPPHTSELQQTAYLEKWITNRKFFLFSLFFLLHIFSGWLERLWIPSRREHAHKSLGFFFLLSFTFTFTLSLSVQLNSARLCSIQFSFCLVFVFIQFTCLLLPVFFCLSLFELICSLVYLFFVLLLYFLFFSP